MKSLKKNFGLILLLVLSVPCIYGQDTDNLELKVAEYIKPYVDMNAWSGNIAIYEKGNPVFQKSYGYADREWKIPNSTETKFRIASISKVFTEVAILKLVEEGVISLDDKLSLFIPDYPRGNEIDIRHLLTHRSGIPHLNSYPNYNELNKLDYELNEVIDLFKNKPLDFEPGARYSYSNSGYVLLAFIIEYQSGMTYESYLKKEIFAKIGMQNSGVDDEKEILEQRARGYMFDEDGNLINAEFVNMSIKVGGGSLYSTVGDLNIFVQKLLQNEILRSTLNELPNLSERNGESIFTANGRVQGFCHQITHLVSKDLTIIVLGNHYSNIALPISDDIYNIYSHKKYNNPINYLAQKVELSLEQLNEYKGTYDFGFGPIGEVKVMNDELAYRAPGRLTYDKLIPIGNNKFFYIQSWVLLEFKNQRKDKYETLDWIMGGNAYPAIRIKKN